jgi:hypothetical protein
LPEAHRQREHVPHVVAPGDQSLAGQTSGIGECGVPVSPGQDVATQQVAKGR